MSRQIAVPGPIGSRVRGVAVGLAIALTPVEVLAQDDGRSDPPHPPPVCALGDASAVNCADRVTEPLSAPGFAMGRARWKIPGTVPASVATHHASYPIDARRIRIVPSVVYLPTPDPRLPGIVSIGLERASSSDPLTLRGELGWSGRPLGSLEVEYRVPERTASLKAEERPAGMVSLPSHRAPGQTLEGSWTERLATSTTASIALSHDSLDLQQFEPEATAGRIDLRHRASGVWDLIFSVAGSSYVDGTRASLQREVASVGTELKAGVAHLAATYRSESHSASPASGHGARVSLRSSLGSWQAGVHADAQQHAATLELRGAMRPDFLPWLVDMGLAGASPEKVLRTLRDHTAVTEQHIELGALRVDPVRLQGGVDLRWRDPGRQRTEVAVFIAMDDMQGTDASRRALLGQIRMSWQLFRETDVTASYANWSLHAGPSQDEGGSQFSVLLRSRL